MRKLQLVDLSALIDVDHSVQGLRKILGAAEIPYFIQGVTKKDEKAGGGKFKGHTFILVEDKEQVDKLLSESSSFQSRRAQDLAEKLKRLKNGLRSQGLTESDIKELMQEEK